MVCAIGIPVSQVRLIGTGRSPSGEAIVIKTAQPGGRVEDAKMGRSAENSGSALENYFINSELYGSGLNSNRQSYTPTNSQGYDSEINSQNRLEQITYSPQENIERYRPSFA